MVTSFTFRAHPLDHDVFAGTLVYERSRWREALASFAALAPELPDDLSVLMTILVPPADWELGDSVLLLLGFAWAGADRARGRGRRPAASRTPAPPDVAVLDPTRWLTFQSAFDAALPKGSRAYWRNASFDRLDGQVIDLLVEWQRRARRIGTAVDLHHMGGAFGRVPEDATAYPSRAGEYLLNIYGFWTDPAEDEARIAWVKGFSDRRGPPRHRRPVRELPRSRRDGPVRSKALAAYGPAKLRAARRGEAQVRPGEPVPGQPQHPAGLRRPTAPGQPRAGAPAAVPGWRAPAASARAEALDDRSERLDGLRGEGDRGQKQLDVGVAGVDEGTDRVGDPCGRAAERIARAVALRRRGGSGSSGRTLQADRPIVHGFAPLDLGAGGLDPRPRAAGRTP